MRSHRSDLQFRDSYLSGGQFERLAPMQSCITSGRQIEQMSREANKDEKHLRDPKNHP